MCQNSDFLFLTERQAPKTVQFVRRDDRQRFVCEAKATFLPCNAIKVWESSQCKKSVTVLCQGNHTLTPVLNRNGPSVEDGLENTFHKNHTITPSQATSNTMEEALREGEERQKIDQLTATFVDARRVESVKKKSRKDDLGHSCEAEERNCF